jgi:Eukaryotic-type carbonic anhydrase
LNILSWYLYTGPETWWLHFPSASGGQQSPIDIVAEEVTFDPELCQHPLTIYYPPPRPEPVNHSGKSNFEEDDDDDDDDAGRFGADFGDSGASAGSRSGMESAASGPKREKMAVVNTGNAVRIDLSYSDSRKSDLNTLL